MLAPAREALARPVQVEAPVTQRDLRELPHLVVAAAAARAADPGCTRTHTRPAGWCGAYVKTR